MNSNQINLYEFPSNLDLKKKETDLEPGVRFLPDWFRKYRFHDLIDPDQTFRLEAPGYSLNLDNESGVRNAELIISYAEE